MRTTWTTKDGRRLAVCNMSDGHLAAALRMGLRAESKRQRDAALHELGCAYGFGNGADELAGPVYDEALRRAYCITSLKRVLATTARYAALVAEAERRGLRLTGRRVGSRTH